jgi:hypothetical protein
MMKKVFKMLGYLNPLTELSALDVSSILCLDYLSKYKSLGYVTLFIWSMSLSNIIPIHNGQQKENTWVPWLFNSASKYVIRNVQNEQGIETKWDTSASGPCWC